MSLIGVILLMASLQERDSAHTILPTGRTKDRGLSRRDALIEAAESVAVHHDDDARADCRMIPVSLGLGEGADFVHRWVAR